MIEMSRRLNKIGHIVSFQQMTANPLIIIAMHTNLSCQIQVCQKYNFLPVFISGLFVVVVVFL